VSAHTPGRLRVGTAGQILREVDSGFPIAYAFSNSICVEESAANAERLAACWNALEGIPTEAIKALQADSLEAARKFVLRLAQSNGSPS